MPNEYYSHTGYPSNSEDAQAIDVRAELLAIQAMGDKLPALAGHADQLVVVNPGATGLIPIPIGKYLVNVSWVPVLSCVTPGNLTIVYATQVGTIHRIGQVILVQFDILTSTFTYTTASGAIIISGLPIISNNLGAFPGALSFSGITKVNYTQYSAVIGGSANTINIDACGSAQPMVSLAITDLPTAGTVRLKGSVMYFGQI